MNTRIYIAGLAMAAFSSFGCPAADDDPTGNGDAGNGEGANDGMTDGGSGNLPGEGGSEGGSGGASEGGSEGGMDNAESGGDDTTFLITPDGAAGGVFECDLWAQDCPKGEKCIAWASDGGTWNATRCSEVPDSPNQPGDTCTAEGGGASGIDDCDIGAMCWDVDAENNGVCVAQCNGNAENPICDDPDTVCSIANSGSLQICLPECDPLLQECVDGQACYPIAENFACAPDASGEMGIFGDPCEFLNVCDPGLVCLNDALTECATASCCTTMCDITAANECAGAGQSCEPWYQDGDAPPGYEDVGVCTIPA